MIIAENACAVSVTLHLKGAQLGRRTLKGSGFGLVVVFKSCHMCNNMSDVRLSNASPTLERVDARQPDSVAAPVRRNLFGSPDRGEIQRYLAAAIQEDVQDFTEEYNFDPDSERPLTPRRYEWQEDHDAPEFYSRPPHRRESPRRDAEASGDDRLEADGRRRRESGGRRRRSGESGSCADESRSKRTHTDDDDDGKGQGMSAGARERTAAEGGPSSGENSAEAQ